MLGGWYWGPLGRPGPTRLGGEGQRGRGRAPDSKEGRAQKSRGEGKCGKASGVKQKVRLRPRRGPRGLEVLGPPGWSCRGPSQRPPPSHGPRGAAGGLLSGPAPRARAANSLPSRDLSRTPCKTRARLGPRDTLEPALGLTDQQTGRLGLPGRIPIARRLGALLPGLCLPCSSPRSQPPTRCWGVGGSDVRPTWKLSSPSRRRRLFVRVGASC